MFQEKKILHISKSKKLWHLLFWIVLMVYYMSASWPYEDNKMFLLERVIIKTILQVLFAYAFLEILIPYVLNKKYKVLFVFSNVVLLYLVYLAFVASRCFYLLPKYPIVYSIRPPLVFKERALDFFAFFGNIAGFIFPIVVLILFEYYKKQKEISSLLEKQRTAELNVLKNQLNPHFLFNTLNNLYTLALKKSDKTPEVIAKLSEILDYILYQCKSDVVPLTNEVKLLKNYIGLEKVRYGKRVNIDFKHNVSSDVKIAPLLLLTFLENAFKHGVSQEINTAKISITLETRGNEIYFNIENTKPNHVKSESLRKNEAIGLKNIKKQLDILYGKEYVLVTNNDNKNYSVTLKIYSNGI